MTDCIASGNFSFYKTPIEGVIIVESKAYGDNRGSFREVYRRSDFEKAGICCTFLQENQSSSVQGVLRGLHYQIGHPQAKLARVVLGVGFDVAVDLRPRSKTFGKWFGTELSEDNGRQLFIPHGFAHGVLALSEKMVFCYKCDDTYHPNDEGGIAWDDPEVGIEWPPFYGADSFDPNLVILSEKDRGRQSLNDYRNSL